MSKQKRDNKYREFQLEWTEKLVFVEGTNSLVSLICIGLPYYHCAKGGQVL